MKYSVQTRGLMARLSTLFLMLTILFTACKEDEVAAPIQVNFANEEFNISSTATTAEVEVIFSRPATANGTVLINFTTSELTYGEANDFYTTPEANDNSLSLNFEQGDESVSFEVHAGNGLNIQSDALITAAVSVVTHGFQAGNAAQADLVFSENFIAVSGSLVLDAGGPDFPNIAFADLSKLSTDSYDRHTWDLGFYAGSDFHVVVNNAALVMARPLQQTDITAVSASDTTGFAATMTVPNYNPAAGAVNWIDNQNGDFEQTAFGAIASSAAEANVFIIKRDNGNWKKVKVYQDGEGYVLEYADIEATSAETIEITKDEAYNFNYISLDAGEVSSELPAKTSWDIKYSIYATNFSGMAYPFNDYVILNPYNTEAVQVEVSSDITFDSFTLNDTEGLEFSSALNAIGSEWRQVGGPNGGTAGVFTDVFYVIKDAEGNTYKLKFAKMTNASDERGYTTIEFELVTE